MKDKYEKMERGELLYELRKAQKKIGDYENIYSKNIQLNECKEVLSHYENYDKLIYLISSKIVNIPIDQIEIGIIDSLKLIANFTETVRCTVYLFSPDLNKIHNTYEWAAFGAEAMKDISPSFEIQKFTYFSKCIRNKEEIILGNLEDLPEDAIGEKEWYKKSGFRPTIMVPLLSDGSFSGILGVYGKEGETKNWNTQLGKQLHLIADIVMSAINIKKSEDELKIAERNFKEFFEQAIVGNVIFDNEGKCKNVNDTFANLTGYSKDELSEMKIKDLVHIDDWTETNYRLKKIYKSEISEFTQEIRLVRKNGKIIWTNFSLTSIKNSSETISGMVGVITDITEQIKNKQAIEGIIKSSSTKSGKMFFETLVKELSYVLNSDYAFVGEINCFNEEYISTLAICENKEIIDNVEFPVSGSPVEIVLEQGLCSIPCDTNLQYPNDIFIKEFEIKCFISIPLFDSKEEIIGVMGAMYKANCQSTDFAEFIMYLFASRTANELERMKNERSMENLNHQLNDKNEELAQIIFVTSHDLRSPLVNVKGFSTELNNSVKEIKEILKSESISPKAKKELDLIFTEDMDEFIGFINSSIDKMDSLLSGLLRLSRLGRAAVIFDTHDSNILLDEVLQTFEFQIQENDIDVMIHKLPKIYGDKIQLNQVFSNIIDNAIKYSDPNKKRRIEISGEEILNNVVFQIKDNGIGIEEKEQARVFEIFHRISPKDEDGLGLGMALVKKIMERHTGKIWLTSEYQKGTTFYVKLPIKKN